MCTENSIRIDYVTESPNLSGDDRAILPLPGPVRLAAQVEEPTWQRTLHSDISSSYCGEGARPCPAHGWRSFFF